MERKFTLSLLLSFFITIGSLPLIAQTQVDASYKLLKEQNGVQISGKKAFCKVDGVSNDYTYLVLKVKNTTLETKQISFKVEMYYEEGCDGCSGNDESYVHLNLAPNEELVGDCANQHLKLTRFLENSSFDRRWKFTGVNLTIQ